MFEILVLRGKTFKPREKLGRKPGDELDKKSLWPEGLTEEENHEY